MGSEHFIEHYEDCGHVASQCRCAAPNKIKRYRAGKCPKCSRLPMNTALDEHFFTEPWGTQS